MHKFLRVFLPVLLLISGLAILLYPRISSAINARHSSRAIQSFTQQVQQSGDDLLQRQLDLARAYNQKLAAVTPDLSAEAAPEYSSILNFDGGMMGYLSIPAIQVELPIYHGVGTVVLSKGVGHMPQSAFPIGGTGNHAVLVGHTGLPKARLFTDLNKLRAGDLFYITVADLTLTYRVDQIKTVLPSVVEDLQPVPGQDYCTLVTCTPYGVNSHRLLVRGARVEDAA